MCGYFQSNATSSETRTFQQLEDNSDFHRKLGAINEHVDPLIQLPYIASCKKYSRG